MLWSFFGIVLLIQSGSNLVALIEFFCWGKKKKVSPVVAHALYVALFYFILFYLFIFSLVS